MIVFNGLSAVFGLASAIALYVSLGSPNAKVAMLVAGAFCSAIAVHQTLNFFMALQLMQRFKSGRGATKQLDERSAASLGKGARTEFINGASVAENTTELLERAPRVTAPKNLA